MANKLFICFMLWLLASCSTLNSHKLAGSKTANKPTKFSAPSPIDFLPALKGGYFPLYCKACGRTYHIFVRLPEGYNPAAAKRYPVVYLLDGDSLFRLLAPTHLFLTYDEKIPEAIIVGIAYGGFDGTVNKRDVDFTAPSADSPEGLDGAPRFLQFLQNELLPTIETNYSIDPSRRVLLGQSRGGYFVLWSALQAPDLFWARIASNPTFTPGRDAFFAAASAHKRQDLKLYLASASRDSATRQQDAAQWAQF